MYHRTICNLFTCAIVFAVTRSLPAQDRVVIQQAGGSRIPVTGYVENYSGRELVFRLKPNESPRRYSRSEVVEVYTEYTPHHEKGRRLFAEGKIIEAKKELATALDEEDRPWVRREILASQARCALWIGDYFGAVSRFTPIFDADAETFHFNLVPLNWTEDLPSTNIRFDAREWTGPGSDSLSKLIGASWLLTVGDSAVEAELHLKRLARDANVRIQRLAQMQLWRVKLGKDIDPNEILRWEKFVDEIPTELRGGSYFVIGTAWKERHEYERAARAFLWLPLVYDSDRWLCARACVEAAESLNALGDATQAANLYSEVVFRYGDTTWGPKAEIAWKAIRHR